ncbi:hypothetical protein E2I00_018345 [Balaenoptera physalus]|uniref:non-specific serine/threonine protein kinase n=1 Tax=Balaenoptera physalus TaxID=9770 RepID=A0A6A1PYL2_BALPH|nr:hypothetical protein E2I00_018345 [Balaenoptera physalus]
MTTDKDTFTKVRCPRHILIGKEVAVKIINKSQQNSSGLQRRSHKVKIMKALGHPNMMKLYEVMETEETLYLVVEYAGEGEMFHYLADHGGMKEKEAPGKFWQRMSTVQYCSQKIHPGC